MVNTNYTYSYSNTLKPLIVEHKRARQEMFRVKRKIAREKETNYGYEDILQLLNTSSETAQSYETLLSSLHLLNSTRPLKTILVTSAQPEEGKTTVSINLAFTMMLANKKALIIDTDLRKPRLHQILKLENMLGFADILNGSQDVKNVIQSVNVTNDTPERNQILSVITSGRVSRNSFNTMGSPKLRDAIEHLRNDYDIVLLDSSPVLSVSDSLLLAPLVDGVILILNTGVVTEKDAKSAKERLEQAGGHILGVVMNRFNEKLHGPGFHPYYGYYHDAKR